MRGIDVNGLKKYFELTGDRAKIDAKAHKTYIVYKDEEGNLIKEHYDGRIEFLDEERNNE